MKEQIQAALDALNGWICDPDAMLVPRSELTKAEDNLCLHAGTIKTILTAALSQAVTAGEDMVTVFDFMVWYENEMGKFNPYHARLDDETFANDFNEAFPHGLKITKE